MAEAKERQPEQPSEGTARARRLNEGAKASPRLATEVRDELTKGEQLAPAVNPVAEGRQWAEMADNALLGSQAELKAHPDAIDKWRSMHLREGVRKEDLYRQGMLASMCREWAEGLAKHLGDREGARQETRMALNQFGDEMKVFLGAQGKILRQAGDPEVAEESEILLIRTFVEKLKALDFEELFRMVDEDKGYLRALTFLNGVNGPTLDDAGDDRSNPFHGPAILDKEHAPGKYEEQIRSVAELIRGENAPGQTPKSKDRTRFEGFLWHGILSKMTLDQRADVMTQFFGPGQQGVVDGTEVMMKCVENGTFTRQDVYDILHKLEQKQGRGVSLFTLEKQLDIAEKVCDEHKEIVDDAVSTLKFRVLGNPALNYLTPSSVFIGETARSVGMAGVLVNTIGEFSHHMKGKKGFFEKTEGFLEGAVAAGTSHYVLGSAALTAVGADMITKGAVRDKLLYSQSKEHTKDLKEKAARERIAERLGRYGNMSDFLFREYDRLFALMQKKVRNGEDAKFKLSDLLRHDEDSIIQDARNGKPGDLEVLGLQDRKPEAESAINSIFIDLAQNLNIRSREAVGSFFDQQHIQYNKSSQLPS